MVVIAFQTIIKTEIALRLIYDFEQIMLSQDFNLPPNTLFGGHINQNIIILREVSAYVVVSFLRKKCCEISNKRKHQLEIQIARI